MTEIMLLKGIVEPPVLLFLIGLFIVLLILWVIGKILPYILLAVGILIFILVMLRIFFEGGVMH
ncbi:MAG: hypothetical protein N2V77_06880 [Canidatus Methanoxibalbensis ujae]|nr:hypothetical protein [Candidatus Methanoxibalbensis ujae]MCW7078329.1 hypothetical protein [Candidatus Methanoxibalbensis ujae]